MLVQLKRVVGVLPDGTRVALEDVTLDSRLVMSMGTWDGDGDGGLLGPEADAELLPRLELADDDARRLQEVQDAWEQDPLVLAEPGV